MKKHIPNFITLLNVFCGSVAAVFAAKNELEWAALFVGLGIVFDFFDGLAARALHVKSELGLQLDSLADVITSGLVPGIVMYQLLGMAVYGGWSSGLHNPTLDSFNTLTPYAGFIITMASAYRLAKFNLDVNQSDSFIGLPTPANSLFIISLPLILYYQGNDSLNALLLNEWFLLGVTLLSAYMLNCNLPLFALKFKNWSFKDNAVRYVFLIVSFILLVTMRFLAIPLIIIFYVLLSVVQDKMMQQV